MLSITCERVRDCGCRSGAVGGMPFCWMVDEHGHPYAHLRNMVLTRSPVKGRMGALLVFTPVDPKEAQTCHPTKFSLTIDMGPPLNDLAVGESLSN